MTLNELDVQVVVEITSDQMRTYEEIIISTPQGNIAYTLNPQIQINKMYRFKGKGRSRTGYNTSKEYGDFYVWFTLKTVRDTGKNVIQEYIDGTNKITVNANKQEKKETLECETVIKKEPSIQKKKLDAEMYIEITSEQLKNCEEIIISTPQGKIAYKLNSDLKLDKYYRFKNKGYRSCGWNVKDEFGDLYVKFTIKKSTVNKVQQEEIQRKEVPQEKTMSLELYCFYSSMEDKYAVPSFISSFSECLEHETDGYYGKCVYIILQAVEDILVITMQYTHHLYADDDKRDYCYKFFMDFTPGSQMHCACSSYFPDKHNQGERDTMKEEDMAYLLNCMSISAWNQDMRDKGYYDSFDIKNDNSIITLNDEHCTITKYIAEAFNLKSSLELFTHSKEQLLPYYIRDLADEMKEKRQWEAEKARKFAEQLIEKYKYNKDTFWDDFY